MGNRDKASPEQRAGTFFVQYNTGQADFLPAIKGLSSLNSGFPPIMQSTACAFVSGSFCTAPWELGHRELTQEMLML